VKTALERADGLRGGAIATRRRRWNNSTRSQSSWTATLEPHRTGRGAPSRRSPRPLKNRAAKLR
jgi:hypothetical protein